VAATIGASKNDLAAAHQPNYSSNRSSRRRLIQALGAEMGNDHLWVEKPKDSSRMMFVFDERMQHEDPSMVYPFNAYWASMKEYKRWFAP
jgi:hypothetical protein